MWNLQWEELSQSRGNPELNEHLGKDDPLQSLVNPTGMWITQASLERIEDENKIDRSMNDGATPTGNNVIKIPALNHYTNYS